MQLLAVLRGSSRTFACCDAMGASSVQARAYRMTRHVHVWRNKSCAQN